MKVTFILKDLSEQFFHGFGSSIRGLLNMSDAEKLDYLTNRCRDLQVKQKVGNGSFRDRVDYNALVKQPHRIAFKLEDRRGYRLATFEVQPEGGR